MRTNLLPGALVLLLALSLGSAACSDGAVPVPDSGQVTRDGAPAIDWGPGDSPAHEARRGDAAPTSDSAPPDAPADVVALDHLAPDLLPPADTMPAPDAMPPELKVTITYPPRGAMLTGSPSINVTGKIVGPLSILAELKINGALVTPDSAGNFSHLMNSTWGLNIITLSCKDTAGRLVSKAQSYHWSSSYWPATPSTPPAMTVTGAVAARLYQKAIDDGNRATLNDLATILEKVVNAVDLDAQIPATLASGSVLFIDWAVVKNGKLVVSPIHLTLGARSGGIHLTGQAAQLSLPVKVTKPITVTGTVKITDLAIAGDINISKASGGAVQVSVPSMTVSYSSLTVDLGSGLIAAVFEAIVNAITSLFKNTITAKFADEIKKALPQPIKDFLGGFKLSQSLTLPPELGGKTLGIYSALDQITFDAYGGNLKLAAAVHAPLGIASGKLGSISVTGAYSAPLTSTRAMEVALRHDSLNQALYATWYSAALNQDLTALVSKALSPASLPFPINNLKLTVEPLLPPILMPSTAGHDFDLGIGDLKVELSFDVAANPGGSVSAEFYVSGRMGGDVTLSTANEIVINLATQPHVFEAEATVFTVQGSGVPKLGSFSDVLKELLKLALPYLGPNIIQRFPIPTIDLSALGGQYGIPPGTVLELQNAILVDKGYHLVLTGDLVN